MAGSSLTVVIPLHDEAEGVPALAQRMAEFLREEARDIDLVLVDDGSTDGTAALLKQHFAGMPCAIRSHDANRGLITALETGFGAASGELVAWLDSDLTYDPAILSGLADAVDAGADVAVASCYHPEGAVEGVAPWRRALSSVASAVYRRITRADIHTFTCMVRVYRRAVLETCAPKSRGFAGVTEVLLEAMRRGYRIAERPATLHRRRVGQSKIRVFRAGMEHLRLMWCAWRAR